MNPIEPIDGIAPKVPAEAPRPPMTFYALVRKAQPLNPNVPFVEFPAFFVGCHPLAWCIDVTMEKGHPHIAVFFAPVPFELAVVGQKAGMNVIQAVAPGLAPEGPERVRGFASQAALNALPTAKGKGG